MTATGVDRILEYLALQKATEEAVQGLDHGSTICRLPAGSWQAEIVRKTADMPQAQNPMELRRLLQDPAAAVIFVPREALLTREIIDRLCVESPLNKMLLWETE